MHDGKFESLEEVVDFYRGGIQDNPNLHSFLKDGEGQPKKFNLTEEDRKALIAFLSTLADMSELGHQEFSDPWK
jgi:cytochrome c peroxidase